VADVAAAAHVAVRCNGREAQARFAQASAGLACLPRVLGDATPGLVLLESPAPPAPKLWSGVHSAAKDIPRVRALLDFVAIRLQQSLY
jgi:DNA-binding transcriptional LysR family regulator